MSDSSVGEIVGGIAGATLGFFAGGPVGAIRGAYIGYGLGGAIDPPPGPTIRAPRLDDLTYQSSAYGTPIKTVYGTIGIHGNVIYLENGEYKEVVTKEEQGGKGGGGATVETVSYYATFAVLLCEAQPGAAIKRIWLGGKLYYSAGTDDLGTIVESGRRADSFRFYDGTQSEPDPRIEAVVGTGSAEAYVGSCFVIFYDLPLEQYGNSLAGCPVKVEIAPTSQPPSLIAQYTSGPIAGLHNERLARCQYFTPTGFGAGIYERFHDFNSGTDDVIIETYTNKSRQSWTVGGAQIDDAPDFSTPRGLNDSGAVYASLQDAVGGTELEASDAARYLYQKRAGVWFGLGISERIYCGINNAITMPGGQVTKGLATDESGEYCYVSTDTSIYKYSRDLDFVASISHSFGVRADDEWGMWHDGGVLWIGLSESTTSDKSEFYSLPDDLSSAPTFEFSLPSNDPGSSVGYSIAEFAVYGNVLYRANVTSQGAGRWQYEQWHIFGLASSPKPLADIVHSECTNSGIPAALVDVQDLQGLDVRGYSASAGDARGALGPLKAAFRFDLVASGYGLKCVRRGGSVSGSIPYEHLGAGQFGQESPRLAVSREMDSQLPQRYEVRYADPAREYDTGMQYADYPTPSLHVRNEEFPIVLTADEAAQLAEVLLDAAHTERVAVEFTLPQSYLDISPADVWTVETPERSYTVRIDLVTEASGQIVEVQARLNNAISYQPTASGETGPEPGSTISLIEDAQTYLVDMPMIISSQDDPGYVAIMGAGLGWPGGVLQRSEDGGQSFASVQAFAGPGSVATARNALPADDGYALDYVGELIVDVEFGGFSSVSLAQMMAGKNYVAYGADGRWEVMQFADATVNADTSLSLTTLARGMHGTEWATGQHQAGDTVILLTDTDNVFVSADIARLGSELEYRGVTKGQAVDDVGSFEFTYQGVNLTPYAPRFVDTEVVGADIHFTVDSRTRYPSSFWYTGVQPQNEPVVKLEADILDGSTVVRTLISSDGDFVYTEAQQVQDFGVAQLAVDVVAYQVSDRVGRGYSASFSAGGGKFDYLGQVLEGGVWIGDITLSDGDYHIIMALPDGQASLQWRTSRTLTPGADSLNDGVVNTDAMESEGISVHPAGEHCVNYSVDSYADWYMPARDELMLAWTNRSELGYLAMDAAIYWASNQFDDTGNPARFAGYIDFNDGSYYGASKDLTRRVRPVRRVKI